MIMEHLEEKRMARDVVKLSPLVEGVKEYKEQAEAANDESKMKRSMMMLHTSKRRQKSNLPLQLELVAIQLSLPPEQEQKYMIINLSVPFLTGLRSGQKASHSSR